MKINRVEKLTSERWVNLFAADYEHNGHAGRWVFASRRQSPHAGGHPGDAVLIVPILRNPGEPPRLVLVREFRVPVGDHVIGLPAGLIEDGEAVEDSIRREIREETGFEVTAVKRITQPLYSSGGLTDEAVALAFIDVRGDAGSAQALEASEDIEVLLLDYEQACRLCDDTSLRIDAKAWAVLYGYQLAGKLE
jgi:ADP-ribose pyrophosphatase